MKNEVTEKEVKGYLLLALNVLGLGLDEYRELASFFDDEDYQGAADRADDLFDQNRLSDVQHEAILHIA